MPSTLQWVSGDEKEKQLACQTTFFQPGGLDVKPYDRTTYNLLMIFLEYHNVTLWDYTTIPNKQ